MPLIDFTTSFKGGPSFFTGTGTTALVPDVFPVAINGRPYLIDSRSNRFTRQFDQRVRDSQDTSTAPGESAISPQGLWRRGQMSWHLGAGQKYADDASAQDYRFYKSKGVNPWTKGQLTLLNATKVSLSNASTTSNMVVQDGRVYVSLNGDVKYTTDPYASSPTWSDCTGEPAATCNAMATNGNKIFFGFANDGIRVLDPASSVSAISGTKFINTTDNYYVLGFAKGFMFGAHDHELHLIDASGSKSLIVTPFDTTFTWVGVATGQNAIYAAGYSNKKSLIYKVTIKADGTLDKGVVALELPTTEIVSAISGYLGAILLGTNKGVRYCTTDSSNNLVAGAIIPTSGSVKKFTSLDRFVWFTWSNYDGVSTGLGRLDLSNFIAANTPAFATDLMYTSTADVLNVITFDDKHCFVVSGVGVVAEDTTNLVASGTIETGTYRWGIPDRKFAPRFDIRVQPLVGSISAAVSFDSGEYDSIGTHSDQADTEHTFLAPEDKFIEAGYKLTLTRQTATTGPTFSRWMSRAYAAPAPFTPDQCPRLTAQRLECPRERLFLGCRIGTRRFGQPCDQPPYRHLPGRGDTYSVIVEDVEWQALDASSNDWLWEGTATVIMRTVTE